MKNTHILTKMVLLALIMAAFSLPRTAVAAQTRMTDEELQQRLEQLEYLKQDLEELMDRLDTVETKTLVDKVNIGAEVRTRFDWYKYSDRGTTSVSVGSIMNPLLPTYDPLARTSEPLNLVSPLFPYYGYYQNYTEGRERVRALPSTRLRLNLAADITENLVFHSRLSMFKNWGDSDSRLYSDIDASRNPQDNTLRVERAYVDFFFGPEILPLALTFGRMPLTDGLPTDLRENTPRKSTYPGLTYDVEGDGLALSIGLEKIIKLPGANLKYAYSNFIADNDSQLYRDTGYNNSTGQLFQFETNLPGALRDTILIVNHVNLDIAPSNLYNLAGLINTYQPSRLGTLSWWTYFVESKNFLDSGLDWFAGYASQDSDPKGLAYYLGYSYPASGTTPAPAPSIVPIGLLNKDGYTDHRSCAWHVGGRYTLPIKALNKPKLGCLTNMCHQSLTK